MTDVGLDPTGTHVMAHVAPFIRKSSVWVKQSCIGPGRSSRCTDAAARRSQSSTTQITGDSMLKAPASEAPTLGLFLDLLLASLFL